jgi:hypothetical protein
MATTSQQQQSSAVRQVRQAVDTVAGAAGEVTARLPEAAATTREAIDEANRLVRQGSDETLRIVAGTSVGLASGLFLAGAPRILVLSALVPAGLAGMALMDRSDASLSRPAKVR